MIANGATKQAYDLILIDDDLLVRENWALAAEEAGYLLLALEHPDELPRHQVDRGHPIFMDLNPTAETNSDEPFYGIEHLDLLHDQGYERLYIATGAEAATVPPRPYLRGIIDKDFPTPAMIAGNTPPIFGGTP